MHAAGFVSLLTVGSWLDGAVAEARGQTRDSDASERWTAKRALVIALWAVVLLCLGFVLPFVSIGALMFVGYSPRPFVTGFLLVAVLIALASAVVLAVRRARRSEAQR